MVMEASLAEAFRAVPEKEELEKAAAELRQSDPEQVSVDRSTKTTLILTTAWIKLKSYSNE